jgi:TPR repeat protein
MISMAVMLAVGQGTRVDAAEARQWYRRAAETGSAHALRGLAGMLLAGEGGRVDAVTGAAYLDLAAKAGDPNARQMQQIFAQLIAAQDQGAVEAAKAAWLRDFGIPR